ncbi:hypothetical protein [Pseudomonas veronii]|uniref:hypothetical protein n=1 Tax=Pseudomonas veronii TaxID=76761 RepID=UPI001681099C|nr:hypothetical protein [Pseudomonas veronii]
MAAKASDTHHPLIDGPWQGGTMSFRRNTFCVDICEGVENLNDMALPGTVIQQGCTRHRYYLQQQEGRSVWSVIEPPNAEAMAAKELADFQAFLDAPEHAKAFW